MVIINPFQETVSPGRRMVVYTKCDSMCSRFSGFLFLSSPSHCDLFLPTERERMKDAITFEMCARPNNRGHSSR